MSVPDTILTWHKTAAISPVTLYTDTDGYTTGMFFTEYSYTGFGGGGTSQYPTLTVDHLGNSTTSARSSFEGFTTTSALTSTLTRTTAYTLTTAYSLRGSAGYIGSTTYTRPVTTYSSPSTGTYSGTVVSYSGGSWDGTPYTLKTYIMLRGGSTMAMGIMETSLTGIVCPNTNSTQWTFSKTSASFAGATSLADSTIGLTYGTNTAYVTLSYTYSYIPVGTDGSELTSTYRVGSVTETVSTTYTDSPVTSTRTATSDAITTTRQSTTAYPTTTVASTTRATTVTQTGMPSVTSTSTNVPSTTGYYQSTSTSTLSAYSTSTATDALVVPANLSYTTASGWITVSTTTGSAGVKSVTTTAVSGAPTTAMVSNAGYTTLAIPGAVPTLLTEATIEVVSSRRHTGWKVPNDTAVYETVTGLPAGVSSSTEFAAHNGVVTPALRTALRFTQRGVSYTTADTTGGTTSSTFAGATTRSSTYATTEGPRYLGYGTFSEATSQGFCPEIGTAIIDSGIYLSRGATSDAYTTASHTAPTTTAGGTIHPAFSYSSVRSNLLDVGGVFVTGTELSTTQTGPNPEDTDTYVADTYSVGVNSAPIPVFTVSRFFNRWATSS